MAPVAVVGAALAGAVVVERAAGHTGRVAVDPLAVVEEASAVVAGFVLLDEDVIQEDIFARVVNAAADIRCFVAGDPCSVKVHLGIAALAAVCADTCAFR